MSSAYARVGSLAFCSSAWFKNADHKIYPPSDQWKNMISTPSVFSDRAILFKDALGLPKSMVLHTPGNEPVVHYRVDASTNVCGWQFPAEFSLAQYRPTDANCWQTHMTATGKLTAIRAVSELEFSSRVDK